MVKAKEAEKIYQDFLKNYKDWSKKKRDNFIKKELFKLPQKIRNKIILIIFIESLKKTSKENKVMLDLQEKGIQAITDLDGAQKDLENELKILDVKKSLNNKD